MLVPPSPVELSFPAPSNDDRPRTLVRAVPRADRVFRTLAASAAATSLLIIGTTAVYLGWQSRPALDSGGVVSFFTSSTWNASLGKFGVFGLLVGTVLIASIALVVAVPLAIGFALFVNEYAPIRLRRGLVSAIDLLAALPSLIFGIWGLFALQGPLRGWAQFLTDHLSAIPFFRTDEGSQLTKSAFVGGVIVGLMILPIITSVTRDVMAQCPREQCEGALALGGSRWGMIRSVILPFARSGTIGAILLGFGRALGETIAVTIIVALQFTPNTRVLTQGGGSIAELIATKFGEAHGVEVNGLIAAGFALFLMTLVVNLGARRIARRTRIRT